MPKSFKHYAVWLSIGAVICVLGACKAGDSELASSGAAPAANLNTPLQFNTDQATTQNDAYRLATQATFGPTEASIAEIAQRGPAHWMQLQFDATPSVYPNDYDLASMNGDYCFVGQNALNPPYNSIYCQMTNIGVGRVQLAFWQQAVSGPDQLRQRVALMLSETLVTSINQGAPTHAMRNYQQILRDNAFGNYRDVLRKVTLSPMMGDWLNLVDSPGDNPNENYARELMELFTIGRCQLNMDGSLVGGTCNANYDDTTVHQYAKALSGWSYPHGPYPDTVAPGLPPFCYPDTPNSCQDGRWRPWYVGDMAPSAMRHNIEAQPLLTGVTVAAGTTGPAALEKVLDSLMQHPNVAPFIAKHFIQFFVTSNPTPGYVQRVATAFQTGTYRGIGSGVKGDLKATITATLLDDEARNPTTANGTNFGKLREPVLYMTSAMRAFNVTTDGTPFSARFGRSFFPSSMGQDVFQSPTVFNFFHTSYPLPGDSTLNGPEFEITNLNTNFSRTNFADWLFFGTDWSQDPQTVLPANTAFNSLAGDNDLPALVDRLDLLFTGGRMSASEKAVIVAAARNWPVGTDANPNYNQRGAITWQYERVANVAYLILTSSKYQIQR